MTILIKSIVLSVSLKAIPPVWFGAALGVAYDVIVTPIILCLSLSGVVDKAIEGKKGAVKYTTPSFVIGDVLTVAQSNDADSNFDTLEAYLKTYLNKVDEVVDSEILVEIEDDLEF